MFVQAVAWAVDGTHGATAFVERRAQPPPTASSPGGLGVVRGNTGAGGITIIKTFSKAIDCGGGLPHAQQEDLVCGVATDKGGVRKTTICGCSASFAVVNSGRRYPTLGICGEGRLQEAGGAFVVTAVPLFFRVAVEPSTDIAPYVVVTGDRLDYAASKKC